MKHPHAEIFIALANRTATINDIEIHHQSWQEDKWTKTSGFISWMELHSADQWQVRIKPKTIKFNGVELPEPLMKAPEEDSIVYVPEPLTSNLYVMHYYQQIGLFDRLLKRGLLHSTKENAIAWAKAMIPLKQEY